MEEVECIVIGAGVVGLATARALARAGREVVIIEAAAAIGSATSSRNNEVIHAGFLYPPGTLKARLCRRGRDALYAYCAEHGVAYERIGKLVIATDETELALLGVIAGLARENGVEDVERLDGEAVRRLEPALCCKAALHSPSTGIIDAHQLMLSLLGDAQAAGAVLALETRVAAARVGRGRIHLRTGEGAGDGYEIACRMLVNAAGLGAREIACALHPGTGADVPPIHYAKGNFFALRGAPPFRRLVVPLARTLERGGAFTLDLAGRGKFGPDVEWVERVDYDVDPRRAASFAAAIRRYYPALAEDALAPDYAGIRPRIQAEGATPADWLILGPGERSRPGVVHLLGIETPGLTACLALGDHVAALLERHAGG